MLTAALSASSSAQAQVVPIVELENRGLLGGVQNGSWIAPTQVASTMKGETEFVLVGWNGVEEGGVTLGKKGEQEDVCQDFTRMELELQQDHGVAIGIERRNGILSRVFRSRSNSNNATYRTVVTNFLARERYRPSGRQDH